uniref:CCHC-type domain-containing protein n=1 Tax=Strigamia maritima TaxID=126957 RepID=T1J498_STRMM
MVCQEEVFSWFKELSGYKRLDVMCGLLNMCLPIELRFFGTCVEELGKKDFHYLRDAENRANNMAELTKLTNLNEDVTRSKLIISLALLESSNHVCSNVIFNILTEFAKVSKALYSDDKIFDEMLLLFTMVLYHPAFTFDQKSAVESQLNAIRQVLKEGAAKDQINDHSVKEKAGSVSEVKDLKYTPVYSHVYPSGATNLNGVFVKSVEVKTRRRNEKRIELKLQVVWVPGKITEIVKTYQDLFEFRQFVIKMCSADPKLQSNEMNIPQLPAVAKPGNKIDENLEELAKRITDFFCSINKLLPQLMGCEPIALFFQGQQSLQWTNIVPIQSYPTSSQGMMVNSVKMPAQQVLNASNQRPKDENPADVGRMKSITIYNSQLDHSGAANQDTSKPKMQNVVCRDVNSKQPATNRYSSPLCTGPCSTPVISPHSSPITSPYASPTQSVVNSRSGSPWIQRNADVTADSVGLKHILSQDRLKKYKNKLINFTVDELRTLSDEDFHKEGLPVDIVTHLRKKLESIRTHPVNGLNLRSGEESSANGGFTMLSVSCPQPVPYVPTVFIPPTDSINKVDSISCSQPSQVLSTGIMTSPNSLPNDVVNSAGVANCNPYTVTFPQLQQPSHPITQISSQSRVASTETSPSCSEYSSPPGSPLEEIRNNYDSSCSEEIDKEKEVEVQNFSEAISGQGVVKFGSKDKMECVPSKKKFRTPEENVSQNLSRLAITNSTPRQVVASNNNQVLPTSASFPKSRVPMNVLPSPSPAAPAQSFKPTAQQQLTIPSSRNTNPTIQENHTGSTPAASTVPVRWDGATASSSTAALNAPVQTSALTMVQTMNQEAACYKTSHMPSSLLVTSAPRHLPIATINVTTTRPLNKSIYSQHSEDSSKLPLCMPAGSHASDSIHTLPYSSTPITYPNLPTSPGVAVTCSPPTFLPTNNCCPSNINVQPPLAHGVLSATSSGCLSNCGCSCNQNVAAASGNLPYTANFLPMNSALYQYQHYMHSHNTNSFMPPPTGIPPPTFHFAGNHMTPPPHIPNGVNPELMYSNTQFSMLQQNGSHSTRVPTQKFMSSANPNIAFHNSYASNPPAVAKAKPVSCYNCGIIGHRGLECKEATMEEITKPGQFRLNYTPTRSTESGD